MFGSFFFLFCEGSNETPVRTLEVRQLDTARLASILMSECVWGPKKQVLNTKKQDKKNDLAET